MNPRIQICYSLLLALTHPLHKGKTPFGQLQKHPLVHGLALGTFVTAVPYNAHSKARWDNSQGQKSLLGASGKHSALFHRSPVNLEISLVSRGESPYYTVGVKDTLERYFHSRKVFSISQDSERDPNKCYDEKQKGY